MKLRKVSGCKNGTCPAVYISDRGTVVAQGVPVDHAEGLDISPGELAVELPAEVFAGALAVLEGGLHGSAR
ncbi:hypothetical protein HUO13_33115 [Saccharopolyspora erythraea]|nr:hypothetical protein [Saccharopolyspora erythraea]QUH04979.1 hypothetical protein HUO13_33115 [Saccharopolyspora erythraea]